MAILKPQDVSSCVSAFRPPSSTLHTTRLSIYPLGICPEHIVLKMELTGKVDVSELMVFSVRLHISFMVHDVVMVFSYMNIIVAEVSAPIHGTTVEFSFPARVCHIFNKETVSPLRLNPLIRTTTEFHVNEVFSVPLAVENSVPHLFYPS